MSTTVKIKKKTALRLTRFLGKLMNKYGKKLSYDDAISYLLEKEELSEKTHSKKQKELSEAAKRILEMIESPVPGAGPEDFTEYEFEDIEG